MKVLTGERMVFCNSQGHLTACKGNENNAKTRTNVTKSSLSHLLYQFTNGFIQKSD